MSKPTQKQQELCDYIIKYTKEAGYPPTISEMASHFGVNINAIQCRLKQCRKKGLIEWIPRRSRTFLVKEK
jgi:repressor LexA